MIIAPNDTFLNQWEDALISSGLPSSSIKRFVRQDQSLLKGEHYVLMSRHSLMSEMRHVLKDNGSILFAGLPSGLLEFLKEKRSNGGQSDTVTYALGIYAQSVNIQCFRTLIIDECHSLRNLMTYGSIGAAVLGILSERTVPMSCTPFINSTQDLATFMTFIDPTIKASYKSWWKEATKKNAGDLAMVEVSKWRKYYMVRREKDVLSNMLPKKTVSIVSVKCYEPELHVYKRYEQSFISAFEEFQFKNSTDPELTVGKKDLTNILLMYLINMVRRCMF